MQKSRVTVRCSVGSATRILTCHSASVYCAQTGCQEPGAGSRPGASSVESERLSRRGILQKPAGGAKSAKSGAGGLWGRCPFDPQNLLCPMERHPGRTAHIARRAVATDGNCALKDGWMGWPNSEWDTDALRTGNSIRVSGKFAEVAMPGSRVSR